MVLEPAPDSNTVTQQQIEYTVGSIIQLLTSSPSSSTLLPNPDPLAIPSEEDLKQPFDYTKSRVISRPQVLSSYTNVALCNRPLGPSAL